MKPISYMFYLCLLFILIHSACCAVLRNRTNNEPGLYTLEDDVYILTIDNFNTTIYDSDRAWMIEFYSNWCGYCQRAVPRVKAFATDVKGWNDLVVVAVLDCANERNAPICEYFQITRYPTFRYIHEHYTIAPENTGLPVVADSHTNFTEHRKSLVNILVKEQSEGRAKRFPNLQPFKSSDISNIYNINNDNYPELAFLVVQEPGDDAGPSVIMDFHIVKEILIRYSYNNETNVINEELPSLYLIHKSGDLQRLNISSLNREGIKLKIREILLSRNIQVPPEVLRNIIITDEIPEPANLTQEYLEFEKNIRAAGDTVFQLDLENALRYSLQREVGSHRQISGEELDAFRKYINVLVKYFPFGEKGKRLLSHLQDYANSSSEIDGHHIAEHIKEVDEPGQNVFSGPKQWLGCRGSTPSLRGYPCGLWKLFHFLTINAAMDPTNTQDTKPTLVLEAMHAYIKNYFGCEDCSEHFQAMAKNRKIFEVQSWEESILWLWRAHNEVNKRLSGDASEDPRNKKIQFPSIQRCPKCYNPDGSWQEVEVLSYLKEMYRAKNINYMYSDPRLLHVKIDSNGTVAAAAISTSQGYRTVTTNFGLLLGGLMVAMNSKFGPK